MTRIVHYVHRQKRPLPKKTKVAPAPGTDRKPVIVVVTSEKQLKLWRQEQAMAKQSDAEVDPQIEAFFARMIRPPER